MADSTNQVLVRNQAQIDRAAFIARYSDPALRLARSSAILESTPRLRALSPEIEAVRQGDQWRVIDLGGVEGPRESLERFLSATGRGDFEAAFQMLNGSWRSRYTPALLQNDFAAEPGARDRLARARAALGAELVWSGQSAALPLGGGKAVRLVREDGAYKIAALE